MYFLFFFFFFKQKTAYEMRISDWSSDVCSSDLFEAHAFKVGEAYARQLVPWMIRVQLALETPDHVVGIHVAGRLEIIGGEIGRASCRERCVSTCRSRWSPYH